MAPVQKWLQTILIILFKTGPIYGAKEESLRQYQSPVDHLVFAVANIRFGSLYTFISSVTMTILIILYICRFLLHIARSIKRRNNFLKNGGSFVDRARSKYGVTEEFRLYTPEEIEKYTDGFNPKRIVGKGGQGKVFRGMLDNGENVAVKRANNIDRESRERFIEEAAILSNLNHPNIIKLLGICLLSDYPMLVYKFLEGGDLYNYIEAFEGETSSRSWLESRNILRNVADALSYMHGFRAMHNYGICHRDVKLENILLDKKEIKNGYVADFGVSKFNESEGGQPLENAIGTYGYFDPVIWREMTYAKVSDVYSYGVVVAQLLTGKCTTNEDFMNGFIRKFIKDVKDGNKGGTFHHLLPYDENEDELWRFARVACLCLKESRAKRPTMSDVSQMLWGSKELPEEYNDVQPHQPPVALLSGSSRIGSSSRHSVRSASSGSGSSSSRYSLSDEEAMLRSNA